MDQLPDILPPRQFFVDENQRSIFAEQWEYLAVMKPLRPAQIVAFSKRIKDEKEDHQINRCLRMQQLLRKDTSIPMPPPGFTFITSYGVFEVLQTEQTKWNEMDVNPTQWDELRRVATGNKLPVPRVENMG